MAWRGDIGNDPGERLRVLHAEAQSFGSLVYQSVRLPTSRERVEIVRLSPSTVLANDGVESGFDSDMWWTAIWPSGVALADYILERPEVLRGRRVLELGCGLGVTTAAALRSGALVTATDHSDRALTLCRLNALRNAAVEPVVLNLEWHDPKAGLVLLDEPAFPVMLAADVLYDPADVDPLLGLIDRLVEPGGELWLAESGRPEAVLFLGIALAAGWDGPSTLRTIPPTAVSIDTALQVTIHRLSRRDRG